MSQEYLIRSCRQACRKCLGPDSVIPDDAVSTLELKPSAIFPMKDGFITTNGRCSPWGMLHYTTEEGVEVHDGFGSLEALESILMSKFRSETYIRPAVRRFSTRLPAGDGSW